MGLFDFFNGKDHKGKGNLGSNSALPWQELTSSKQLDALVLASDSKIQVIFKHSTRCGISRMVMRQFEQAFDYAPQEVALYYLDLLNYREVSDEIASKFQVQHQSPQLIVVKEGAVIHHQSHHDIDALTLQTLL